MTLLDSYRSNVQHLVNSATMFFDGEILDAGLRAQFADRIIATSPVYFPNLDVRGCVWELVYGDAVKIALEINEAAKFVTIDYNLLSHELKVVEGLYTSTGQPVTATGSVATVSDVAPPAKRIWHGKHPYFPSILAEMPESWHPHDEPESQWRYQLMIPMLVNAPSVDELSTQIIEAVYADEKSEGCDIGAGMFGPRLSALVVQLANLHTSHDAGASLELFVGRKSRDDLAALLGCHEGWPAISYAVQQLVEDRTWRSIFASTLREQFVNVARRNGYHNHTILTDEDTRDQKFADSELEHFYKGYLVAMARNKNDG